MPRIILSNRARRTPPSPIRSLSHLAEKAKGEGVKIYHLNIGQPDIETPREFFEGLRLYDQRVVAYEASRGNPELCRIWSKTINSTLKVSTRPDDFLITMGASEALVFLFMTCCDPGDEIITFDPTYANYMGFAAVSGVNLIPILSDLDEGFATPPRDALEQAISNRTRAILLCNPNNPTGSVYGERELRFLLDLCDEYNLFLIVDETYREFVYDGLKPLSLLQLAPENSRVIVVDSLSKRYSLCGARLGCFITVNEEVISTALNIAQARLSAPTIEQAAAAHMLKTISPDYIDGIRSTYERRRNRLFEALAEIPDIAVQKPKGAFYCIVRLPVDDAEDFAKFLLNDFRKDGATSFVAPALGFYMQNHRGRKKIRLAYVLEEDELSEAIAVIGMGLKKYNRRG